MNDDGRVIDSFSIDNNSNPASNPNTSTTPNTVQLSFQQGVNGYSGTQDTFIQQIIAAIDNSKAILLTSIPNRVLVKFKASYASRIYLVTPTSKLPTMPKLNPLGWF